MDSPDSGNWWDVLDVSIGGSTAGVGGSLGAVAAPMTDPAAATAAAAAAAATPYGTVKMAEDGAGVDAGEMLYLPLGLSSPPPDLVVTPMEEEAAAAAAAARGSTVPLPKVKREGTPAIMEALTVKTERVSAGPSPRRDGPGASFGIGGAKVEDGKRASSASPASSVAKDGNGVAGFTGEGLDAEADVDVDVDVGDVGDDGRARGVGASGGAQARAQGSSWEEEKAQSLREAVRLSEGQALALGACYNQWEDELLVAMVLSKVSSALRTPGKMELPAVQETAQAFESLASEEQRYKFRNWVDSNREAVDQLDRQYHRQHYRASSEVPGAGAGAGAVKPLSQDASCAEAGAGAGPGADGGVSDHAMTPSRRHRAGSTRRGQFFGGEDSSSAAGYDSRSGGSLTLSPAVTSGVRGRQQHPAAEGGKGWGGGVRGVGAGNDGQTPRATGTRSRGEQAASPQFRFRGHLDGSGSGGEDGGGVGRDEAAALVFALAMDQSP
ncbi:unnamed protein product [Scytosiphon promiscuus]